MAQQIQFLFEEGQLPSKLTGFVYKDDLYIRCIPSKMLFRSTMVHEVVNRGDIFAMRIRDQMLTIIPGSETPELVDVHIV